MNKCHLPVVRHVLEYKAPEERPKPISIRSFRGWAFKELANYAELRMNCEIFCEKWRERLGERLEKDMES